MRYTYILMSYSICLYTVLFIFILADLFQASHRVALINCVLCQFYKRMTYCIIASAS